MFPPLEPLLSSARPHRFSLPSWYYLFSAKAMEKKQKRRRRRRRARRSLFVGGSQPRAEEGLERQITRHLLLVLLHMCSECSQPFLLQGGKVS